MGRGRDEQDERVVFRASGSGNAFTLWRRLARMKVVLEIGIVLRDGQDNPIEVIAHDSIAGARGEIVKLRSTSPQPRFTVEDPWGTAINLDGNEASNGRKN